MKKKNKKEIANYKKSLPALVEEFAQLLREKAHTKSSLQQPAAPLSNMVEQIAKLLRTQTHAPSSSKKKKTSSRKKRTTKKLKK